MKVARQRHIHDFDIGPRQQLAGLRQDRRRRMLLARGGLIRR